MNDSVLLSAYLLYKRLYDKNNDIYSVIVEFIKFIIKKNNKLTFNSLEIKNDLKKEFEFNIPESVIKTSLKRLKNYIKKEYGEYKLINKIAFNVDMISIFQQYEVQNNKYLDEIIEFIKEKTNTKVDKIQVIQSLQYYILDDNLKVGKYNQYIAEYIIKNESRLKEWLQNIKEGFLLYSALEYEEILNRKKVFDRDLTFFLDTEILFHATGYNGEVYKRFFDDFYSLYKEANRKSKKVYLKYFQETKGEIEFFFKKAEDILEKGLVVDPRKTAMKIILSDCLTKSDIAEKRVKFFDKLKILGIECKNIEIYNDNDFKHNLIAQGDIEKIVVQSNFDENEVYKVLEKFSKIAKLKQSNISKNIFETEYLLISENSKYFKILAELKTDMYLLTHLDFVINKFWLKLQKGFENHPLSLDVVTKAKVVLSSLINENISYKFELLKKDYYQEHKTQEDLVLAIAEFKEKVLKPEDINEYNVEEIIEILESDVEEHVKKQQFYKNELENEKNKTIKQQRKIENLSKIQKKLEEKNQKAMEREEKLKSKAEKKALKKYKSYKITLICVFICIFLFILGVIVYKKGWDFLGFAVGLSPVVEIFVIYLGLGFLEKEINPKLAFINHLDNKKKKYLQQFYEEYAININYFDKILDK